MSDKLNSNDSPESLRRRQLLSAGSAGVVAAALGSGAAMAEGAATGSGAAVSVAADGNYERVPLRKDSLRVTAVQSIMRAVRDTANPEREMKANLDHMLDLIDRANGFPGPQGLVCFHEQPIMGWNPWTREEVLRVAIEIPGPETEALGKKAREYGCYITFGTYAKDPDWPGHLLLNGVLIGPEGNVVANHWKTNNIRGFIPGWDIFTTGIYDVLDRYREMYGEDAVLQVARTDIGNISCSITPSQPDVIRALAMKGLEIRLSSSSGGYSLTGAQTIARHNRLWSVVCNQSATRPSSIRADRSRRGPGPCTRSSCGQAFRWPRSAAHARFRPGSRSRCCGRFTNNTCRVTVRIPKRPISPWMPQMHHATSQASGTGDFTLPWNNLGARAGRPRSQVVPCASAQRSRLRKLASRPARRDNP